MIWLIDKTIIESLQLHIYSTFLSLFMKARTEETVP